MGYYYDKEEEIIKKIQKIEEEIYYLLELAKRPELFEFAKEE